MKTTYVLHENTENDDAKDKCIIDTKQHIANVDKFMSFVADAVNKRKHEHDASKLQDPELQIFTEYTPKLAGATYGSDEYKTFLKEMKPALDHHYKVNRHHPEHFENGIKGMDLVDVIELICDWKAASLRHDDGDIMKSIEINQKRFSYSDDLKAILINTAKLFDNK